MSTITSTPASQSQATQSDTLRDDIKYLRSILPKNKSGMINEEKLFAGIIAERVKVRKGSAAATAFNSFYSSAKKSIGKAAHSFENAAREALRRLIDTGVLNRKEAVQIHSEAFYAAQIDNVKDKLFDGRGKGGDGSVARRDLEGAISTAVYRLNQVDSGKVQLELRSLELEK